MKNTLTIRPSSSDLGWDCTQSLMPAEMKIDTTHPLGELGTAEGKIDG